MVPFERRKRASKSRVATRALCEGKGSVPLPNLSNQLCTLQEGLLDTLTAPPSHSFPILHSLPVPRTSLPHSTRDALCHSTRRRCRSPRPLGGAGSVRRRRTDCSWSGRGVSGAFHFPLREGGRRGSVSPPFQREKDSLTLADLSFYMLSCAHVSLFDYCPAIRAYRHRLSRPPVLSPCASTFGVRELRLAVIPALHNWHP